ncbi:heme-binding protein [Mycobacterium sp. TY815]|uniref:GlcG/HbpS family heme-binding protein n=1 Tax=Mycobacterium sp. TY815 TaxID=3050581 RepID=UPI002740F69D|nr:heme-binding protein [Mycobacterium sp. TY815]MDP7704811.1 heme-binding protein [Mycobacterium sp. TY815]
MVSDLTRVPVLTLAGAQRILDGSLARARSLEVAVCVAVSDRSGQLLAFARMDGAAQLSVSIAQDKAYTVAAFGGVPTHQWFELIKDDPPLLHGIVKTERLIVFGGGVPVWSAGQLAGAVGVSGGSAEQDRAIAEAGAGLIR